MTFFVVFRGIIISLKGYYTFDLLKYNECPISDQFTYNRCATRTF